MDNYNEYHKSIDFIESLSNLVDKNYYSRKQAKFVYGQRMKYFLSLLGNPHKKIKYIHITGTSGKGSTALMCHNILKESKINVGLYTSPHLTEFIERIKVNDKYINPKNVVKLTKKIKKALEKYLTTCEYDMISYGEIVFSMALLYFVQKKCKYAVVEVGCGGLCDYTNIIPNTKIALITNIGHDHLKVLGPKLSDVAREKVGIVKKGTTLFTTEKKELYLKIFQSYCKKVDGKYNKVQSSEFRVQSLNKKITFSFQGSQYSIPNQGTHQIDNALLAINAGLALKIKPEIINKGLQNIKLPAKFEIIQNSPAVIIDSAHNLEKIKSTIEALQQLKNQENPKNSANHGQSWLIFSFTEGKNMLPIIKLFKNSIDKLIITRHTHLFRKACMPKDIISEIKKFDKSLFKKYFLEPKDAISYALKNAKKDDIILITGSLYMAGTIREHWVSKKYILKNRKI